jgi:nucleotide-binding universal stress UspA family protein
VKNLQRVLCAVDVDEPGRAAFAQALALARVRDAALLVVCPVPPDRTFNQDATERVTYLRQLRAAADAAGVDLRVSVQSGDPAEIVVLHASDRGSDLIVIGADHGRSGGRRASPVAEDVARSAPCPTLMVRTGSTAPAASFSHALLAIDVDAPPLEAADRVLPLVDSRGHRLTFLHVVNGPAAAGHGRRLRGVSQEYYGMLANDALQRLQALIPSGRQRSALARVSVGNVGQEILRAAQASKADLLVVGTKPRGRVGRRLFGIMQVLLADSHAPVLAMPLRPDVRRQRDGARRAA